MDTRPLHLTGCFTPWPPSHLPKTSFWGFTEMTGTVKYTSERNFLLNHILSKLKTRPFWPFNIYLTYPNISLLTLTPLLPPPPLTLTKFERMAFKEKLSSFKPKKFWKSTQHFQSHSQHHYPSSSSSFADQHRIVVKTSQNKN